MIIYNHQTYILLFFIYSFAGWFMESVGGILNVKKFINRGFLIGPYCPVYGVGVILITILLQKYVNDFLSLYILSILICGILEYATGYIMEKCFNARWWDYSKRKFNINGRVCLETLLPFGFIGSLFLKIVNPFLAKYINMIPLVPLNIITYGFLVIFLIDLTVSFFVINSFKKETYKIEDNTEEIAKKVKEATTEMAEVLLDKTEYALMQAESDIIVFSRRLRVKGLKFERKIKRYKSPKLSDVLKYEPKEFIEKLKYNRKLVELKVRKDKEEFEKKVKKAKVELEIKMRQNISEFNSKIKNVRIDMSEKSILFKRLIEAFPNLKFQTELINEKIRKIKKENNKEEKKKKRRRKEEKNKK